jgi:hypothetical protein
MNHDQIPSKIPLFSLVFTMCSPFFHQFSPIVHQFSPIFTSCFTNFCHFSPFFAIFHHFSPFFAIVSPFFAIFPEVSVRVHVRFHHPRGLFGVATDLRRPWPGRGHQAPQLAPDLRQKRVDDLARRKITILNGNNDPNISQLA